MINRKIWILLFTILIPFVSFSKGFGNVDKNEQNTIAKIKLDIDTLCSKIMEGRLTGSEGELLAAKYIENRFQQIGLNPYFGKYKYDFATTGGQRLGKNAYFKLFDKNLILNNDVIFMPYGEGNAMSGFAYPEVHEQENVWLVSLKTMSSFEQINPQKSMYQYAKEAVEKHAKGIIFLNDIGASVDLSATNLGKFDPISIPVAFISHKAYNYFIKPNLKKDWIEFEAKLGYEDFNSTGKNVLGFIDNRASSTIVVGAHYDHIGNVGAHYAGADNNASGVAGLLYLAEKLKNSSNTQYNYLFVAFSGSNQNLQGSKAFVKQNETLLNTYSCMINLERIGRLNSKTRNLFLNGINTSSVWLPTLLKTNITGLNLNIDSSGYGFSDYTSFYLKNIPVLNITAGYHSDYLTVNDIPSKVSQLGIIEVCNFAFRIIADLNKQQKPNFQKTYDVLPDLQKLKVEIGIIPDFTFNNNGIRIDACMPGKLADKSGLQTGDIIQKIGDFTIIDFDDYIEAIKKSNKEKETTFRVTRDGIEFKFFILLKD